MKPGHAFVLLSASFLLFVPPALANSADETQAVIVTFQPDTPFHQFRTLAYTDDRQKAEPAKWAYLERGVMGTVQRLEGQHRFKSRHVYSHAVKGFSGNLTQAQIEALKAEPTVASIEPDGRVRKDAQTMPWGIDKVDADISSTKAGNGRRSVKNVTVYVIDSGIGAHPDLNFDPNDHINFAGGVNSDCDGHGTHVAGTIAAKDNDSDVVGVAPGAKLYGVKVLNCQGDGWWSDVIKGLDWVKANAVKPAVANMSIGGDLDTPLDNAVLSTAASGVFMALSAGNDSKDACRQSPARAGENKNDVLNGVIATAATNNQDKAASFSNYGKCVDIWAPGDKVLSTRLKGGTTTMSGTSMASPHVAGAAALYLSRNPAATPVQVEEALISHAVLTGASKKGWPVLLLNVDAF